MFFLLIVFIAALIVIIFLDGKIENLLNLKFRYSWLVLIAVVIKIASISGLCEKLGLPPGVVPYLRVFSLFMVIVFVLVNINLRGLWLIGLGLLSNSLVITLNGGNMPVNNKYAHLIASGSDVEKLRAGLPVDSFILSSSNTKLNFLGDVLLMPQWIPLSKLFSIGDVFITLGGILFVSHYLKYDHFNKT